MNRSMPGLPVHHQLPEFTQTHVYRVSDAIQPSSVVPFSSCPSPSQHQSLFQWVNSLHEVAKVLEFQLQHQSFQWTPKTCLLPNGLVGPPWSPRDSQESSPTPQFKSISSLALIQLSHPYMTTGKTIALTRQTFVGKVISLLLNMLCRLVITFLPRSKRLLISWLQSPSAVILEPPKILGLRASHILYAMRGRWKDFLPSSWSIAFLSENSCGPSDKRSLAGHFKTVQIQASLVVQRLRIGLPMQGTQVQSLIQEDPTCHKATKPMHHNYWALKP